MTRVGRVKTSERFQSRVSGDEPLGTDVVELDLYPALLADPFEVEHYAFAEFRMQHPLAKLDAAGVQDRATSF